MAPRSETTLRAGDKLLLAGDLPDRAALTTAMTETPTASYVVDGRRVPTGWVWRRFAKVDSAGAARVGTSGS